MSNNVALRASRQARAMIIGLAVACGSAESRSLQRFRGTAAFRSNFLAIETGSACGVTIEIVETSPITIEEKADCLCKEGQFWHAQQKKCVDKAERGYECGFFPVELHPVVCKPGLICKLTTNTNDARYFHEGAAPANCQPCEGDECLMLQPTQCAREYAISGEACTSIRVIGHGGVGEIMVKACVGASEVMTKLGIDAKERVGAKWAAKVIVEGDLMAHDKAMAMACQATKGAATTTSATAATKTAAPASSSSTTAATTFPTTMAASTTSTTASTTASTATSVAASTPASTIVSTTASTTASTIVSTTASTTASTIVSTPASIAASTTASTTAIVSTTPSTTASTMASTSITWPQPPTGPPVEIPMVKPASEPRIMVPRKTPTDEVAETLP